MAIKHRTLIGLQSTDNKINVVQCDNDGFLETTGTILNSTYNTLSSVNQLMEEGINSNDLFVLGKNYWSYPYSSSARYLKCHNNRYKYLYLFSEADNKWYVSSNDNPAFNSLADLL
jgi:hypothetical protein